MSIPFINPIPLPVGGKVLNFASMSDFDTATITVFQGQRPASGISIGDPNVMDTLSPTITLKSVSSKIIVDVTINGEWNQQVGNKGINLTRIQNGDNANSTTIYGANAAENRGRTISGVITNGVTTGDNTMDGYVFRYVDDFTFDTASTRSVGDTLRYAPVLTQFDTGTFSFFQNRTVGHGNGLNREVAVSSITLTEVLPS